MMFLITHEEARELVADLAIAWAPALPSLDMAQEAARNALAPVLLDPHLELGPVARQVLEHRLATRSEWPRLPAQVVEIMVAAASHLEEIYATRRMLRRSLRNRRRAGETPWTAREWRWLARQQLLTLRELQSSALRVAS